MRKAQEEEEEEMAGRGEEGGWRSSRSVDGGKRREPKEGGQERIGYGRGLGMRSIRMVSMGRL